VFQDQQFMISTGLPFISLKYSSFLFIFADFLKIINNFLKEPLAVKIPRVKK